LLATVLCLYLRDGRLWLSADLTGADEGAHFTSGVLVHDYVTAPKREPLRFASCFYVQYPKIGLGQWPPAFYLLEAGWFALGGVRVAAARILVVLIAVACAALLYRVVSRLGFGWQARAAAACFLLLPPVRHEAWRVMSDLLLALLVLLTLDGLARYLEQPGRARALRLAAWTGLAILTKGTGWLLVPLVLGLPAFLRRTRIYLRFDYWLAVLGAVAMAAPFYLLASALRLGYDTKSAGHWHRLTVIAGRFPPATWVGLLLLAAVVLLAAWRRRPRAASTGTGMAAGCAAWIAIQVLFLALMPLTPELGRYYLPSLAPALFLLCQHLRQPWPGRLTAAAVLCAGALAAWAIAAPRPHVTGVYSRALRTLPGDGQPQVILAAGGPAAEGAVVAAQFERDPGRRNHILRSTKFLSTADWNGRRYSPQFRGTEELSDALLRVGVEYVILDTAVDRPDLRLLRTALEAPGSQWQASGRLAGYAWQGEVLVYRRAQSGQERRKPVSVRLGPERDSQIVSCE
jgi:hypothetical protein